MIHDVISTVTITVMPTAFVAPELLGTKKGENTWAKGKNTCAKVPFPEEEPACHCTYFCTDSHNGTHFFLVASSTTNHPSRNAHRRIF